VVNKKELNKEIFDWAQGKLEQGKFPCICGHFESSHVKRMCLACHGGDEKKDDPTEHWEGGCWHPFKAMDNLSLVEWMAAHKGELNNGTI
jgi:hypothetical protein